MITLHEQQSRLLRAPVRCCDQCNEVLNVNAKGPLCGACISKNAKKRITECTVCGEPLSRSTKNGLCMAHYLERVHAQREEREVAQRKPLAPFTVQDLIAAAWHVTGVPKDEIAGPRRFKSLVRVRAAIYHIAVSHYSRNYIGDIVGGRDHTTVMHGLRYAEERVKFDWKFRALVERIEGEAQRVADTRRRALMAQFAGIAA